MKKLIFTLVAFALCFSVKVSAQEQKTPDWKRWHYLSEEEMNTPVRAENFVETDPPTGTPRFVAEFEPMQGVMIRYPLGIPTSLVVDLANNCHVYCVTQQQGSAQSAFQNAGVNMNNVTFVNAPTDSYWIRDYGPWYIFEDRNPAIVDNIYNRPRPNDDNISGVFSTFWNIPMYGMNLEHTGGNMMEDGRGHGVSDNLVFQENGYNETNVRTKMRDYLGIDPYHVTIDPQGDYIAHVDCWGKYLAPDKILIAQLPSTNSHYADYEQVAEYFANTNCCWGYPYRVYRVQEPGGYTIAPYTNSLILNKSVYVPMGDNATYNEQALQVYQEAMPGYEIVGVTNNDYYISWENTDALHCRTRGVMDFNMLFVDHRDVYHGEEEWQAEYPVTSKFIAYSGMDLKQDSLLVYYSIDGGAYQVAHMTATGEPDEYVGYITGYQGGSEIDYYVFGADESGHRYTQPVFAELDPHHFTVGPHSPSGELVITPTTLWFEQMGESKEFDIINETTNDIVINSIESNDSYLVITPSVFPETLPAGGTMHVVVDFLVPPTKDYIERTITISTSVGIRTVTAMLNSNLEDWGLWIPGAPSVELTANQPQATPYVVNGNYGSQTPITIINVFESLTVNNPDGYLEIEYPELPYTLEAGQNFEFTVRIKPNLSRGINEFVHTAVCIATEDGGIALDVFIDEALLGIDEISAETKVYPNPMNNVLYIEGNDIKDVTIFNAVGQQVLFVENANSIDVAELNEGLYFVRINDKKGNSVVKKIVKK